MRLPAVFLPALIGLAAMAQAPQVSNPAPGTAPAAVSLNRAWTDVVTLKPETLVGAFDGDRVYYQNSFHHLVARDAHSGKTLWDFKVSSDPGRLSLASKDLLLNLDGDSLLHGLDAATGKERWKVQLQSVSPGGAGLGSLIVIDGPMTKPILKDGTIYLGTYGTSFGKGRTGSLYALEAATGKVIWSLETEDGIENDLILKDGKIYAGGVSAFYTVDAKSGKVIWKSTLRNDNQWSAQLMGGKLYVSSGRYGSKGSWFSGTLYCLDPETGKQVWTYDIGGPSPIRGADGVLVGVQWGTFGGSKLVGLNAADGKELWTLDEKGLMAPLIQDGRVLHLTKDDEMRILDLHSGKELATVKAAGTFEMSALHPWDHVSAPFELGDKLFVASWGGSKKGSLLQQVDLKSGKVLAETSIPGKLITRPAAVGGRVAVLTDKPEGSLSIYE